MIIWDGMDLISLAVCGVGLIIAGILWVIGCIAEFIHNKKKKGGKK